MTSAESELARRRAHNRLDRSLMSGRDPIRLRKGGARAGAGLERGNLERATALAGMERGKAGKQSRPYILYKCYVLCPAATRSVALSVRESSDSPLGLVGAGYAAALRKARCRMHTPCASPRKTISHVWGLTFSALGSAPLGAPVDAPGRSRLTLPIDAPD